MNRSVALVCALLLAGAMPIANAQTDAPTLQDDTGDVALSLYDESNAMPGGWDNVDLVSLLVQELPDDIHFVVGVAGFPDCVSNVCQNSGDTRTYFSYGEKKYELQVGTNLNGFYYAQFSEIVGGEFNRVFIQGLTVVADLEAFTYTVDVPRELIVDETGSPPRKDTQIHSIYTRSYSQVSFGGPDPDDPMSGEARDMLTTSDNMGIGAEAAIELLTGGVDASGDLSLTTSSPYRASNGGDATYRYDLQAVQNEADELFFDLVFENVPVSWDIEHPAGVLRLPAGQTADFAILVTTPFGHQHGGSDAFTFKIVERGSRDLWASVDLGVHYVTVPQPSGHHPTLWFHTTSTPEPFSTTNSAIGGADGQVFMNTLEDDGGDEEVPVQGWTGLFTNDVFHWGICMQPELLLGLDLDMDSLGTLEFPLSSTRGYSDVVVSGRVLHVGPGDDIQSCFSNQWANRPITEIATIDDSEPATLDSGTTIVETTVTPLPAGDFMPYEKGTMLVLEIEANPADIVPINPVNGGGGTALSGAEAMSLMPGGQITLPLLEYSDSRPQGLVGWSDPTLEVAEAPEPQDEFVTEVKEAPAVALAPLAGAVALLGALVRRHTQ